MQGYVRVHHAPDAGFGFDPDSAAVSFDDFLAGRQTDTGSLVRIFGIQVIERYEDI